MNSCTDYNGIEAIQKHTMKKQLQGWNFDRGYNWWMQWSLFGIIIYYVQI